jgi:hypothetical protein
MGRDYGRLKYLPASPRVRLWSELQHEPRSRAAFELEPADAAVKLTVTYEGFARAA